MKSFRYYVNCTKVMYMESIQTLAVGGSGGWNIADTTEYGQ